MNISFWSSKNGFVALLFIAAVSYFLLIEHRQHFFEWLPYLIILACPAMHLFMHHGHGGRSDTDSNGNSDYNSRRSGNGAGSNDERVS
ncbi:MAG: DUF2933 domain-containing protein [Gammaproteobacteria bacterium]